MNNAVLNNREIATLVWTAFALGWVLCRIDLKGVMRSLRGILKALLAPTILVPLFLYLGVLVGVIAAAGSVGLWTPQLIKSTALWALVAGVGLYFSVPQVLTGEPVLRRLLSAGGLGLVVFEVVVNFASFPLIIELVGIPLVGLGVLIVGYGEIRPVDQRSLGCVNVVVAAYGFAALAWTCWVVARDWNVIDVGVLWREALLPVWLTLAAASLVYAIAVFAYYERAFGRIDRAAKGESTWRQKAALLSVGRIDLGLLRSINGLHHMELADRRSFRDARAFLRSRVGG